MNSIINVKLIHQSSSLLGFTPPFIPIAALLGQYQ